MLFSFFQDAKLLPAQDLSASDSQHTWFLPIIWVSAGMSPLQSSLLFSQWLTLSAALHLCSCVKFFFLCWLVAIVFVSASPASVWLLWGQKFCLSGCFILWASVNASWTNGWVVWWGRYNAPASKTFGQKVLVSCCYQLLELFIPDWNSLIT